MGFKLFICFSILMTIAAGANILAIFPLPSKSHFVMFENLLIGLSEKGHQIDVYSHFPLKHPPVNYTDYSLEGIIPTFVNSFGINLLSQLKTNTWELTRAFFDMSGTSLCDPLLSSRVLQNLKNSPKKYDLFITEIFATDCMLAFAHHFQIPTVSLTTSADLPWGGIRLGNPTNPAYIGSYFSGNTRMSFINRFLNTYSNIYWNLAYKIMSVRPSNLIIKKHFGKDFPELPELIQNISLLLINSHWSINQPRPTVPNVIEVGGLHLKKPQKLSTHLENVLKSKHGVIYFSMGSLIQSHTIDLEKLQAFCDAFAKLPQKILWKNNKEHLPKELKIPNNVHFEAWFPQRDVLCHPNIKVFISHGGLMGTQEAVYCGVPRLGIPMFADQASNIKKGEDLEMLVSLDYEHINKDNVLNSLKELLTNPKYKQNALKHSDLFRSNPVPPLDLAIYWVEHVIKHNGAPHLRSPGADLPIHEYYLLDVFIVSILIVFLIIYSLYVLVSLIARRTQTKFKEE